VEKESLWFRLSIPKGFERYFIPKGYVALDGTSLTVCDVVDPSNHQGHQQEGGGDSSYFTIMLVAYTQKDVILPLKQKGDLVNVEVDMISKYVERNFLLSQSQHLSPLASASASENIRR
jgi:riboflavin synthase